MPLANQGVTLTPTATIAAAATVTGLAHQMPRAVKGIAVLARFLYGSGGTAVKVYLQTSLDGGTNWVDIMCITFATTAADKISVVHRDTAVAASITPTDVTLTDDSILNGLVGDRVRAKYVSTGTYAGATSITVDAVPYG
jgi:hypothetical protein|tara:strand:- start:26513 stop:26932 length:420 start_codon:yes stop_codon:yes gene_type:complete